MADNAVKPTVKTSKDVPWCKSLESLPVFTKKEIDEQRSKSGKRKIDDTSKPIQKKTTKTPYNKGEYFLLILHVF